MKMKLFMPALLFTSMSSFAQVDQGLSCDFMKKYYSNEIKKSSQELTTSMVNAGDLFTEGIESEKVKSYVEQIEAIKEQIKNLNGGTYVSSELEDLRRRSNAIKSLENEDEETKRLYGYSKLILTKEELIRKDELEIERDRYIALDKQQETLEDELAKYLRSNANTNLSKLKSDTRMISHKGLKIDSDILESRLDNSNYKVEYSYRSDEYESRSAQPL